MGVNLHIVRNGVSNDSRVLKETASLRDSKLFSSVEIAGFEHAGLPEYEDIGDRRLWRVGLKTRGLPTDLFSQLVKFSEWAYRIVSAYKDKPVTVIHCNDLAPLPIAVWLKRFTGAKIVYDAHELETERANVTGLRQRMEQATEKRYMKHVDAMLTVSPSIQSWYRERYPQVPVSLVRNVPSKPLEAVAPMDLRGKFNVPKSSLLFIYLGGHAPGRGIDTILKAFSSRGVRHHVAFVGDGVLAEAVKIAAQDNENIHWLPPVPPDSVLSVSAGADVGLSLIEDISLSYRFALPNKLFECWIAGIPVVVSNLPDQARLVQDYNAGWVAPADISELAKFLDGLDYSDLDAARPGVEKLRSQISWENEAEILISAYRHVLDQQSPA